MNCADAADGADANIGLCSGDGFVYLAVVLDWFSRRALSWRVSIRMEVAVCVEILEDALVGHGKPEIFNTHQGSQFTAVAFAGVLIFAGMDGKGALGRRSLRRAAVARRQVRGRSQSLRQATIGSSIAARIDRLRANNGLVWCNHNRPKNAKNSAQYQYGPRCGPQRRTCDPRICGTRQC